MNDFGSAALEARYQLGDVEFNTVRRRIARLYIPYALAHLALISLFAVFCTFLAGRGWVETYVDSSGSSSALIWSGVGVWLLYNVWTNGKSVGSVWAQIRRSNTTLCKGLVDGVTCGDCTTRLTEDAMEWHMRDYDYALNLNGIQSAKHHGNLIFVRNNLAEYRYSFASNAPEWVKTIKSRMKARTQSDWAPPDGFGWRSYTLSSETYTEGLSDLERQTTPPGSLWLGSIDLIGHVFILGICLTSLSEASYDWRTLVTLVVFGLSLCTARHEVTTFLRGILRRRGGMTPYGRDVAGVTHAETAYFVGPDGIEIHRARLRRKIRWAAIASVEQKDGWLSLRSGETTLDVLPSTPNVTQALANIGFETLSGPWEMTKGSKTLEKAA